MVSMLERAIEIVEQADVVLVIGTSLQVYPANGLAMKPLAIRRFT